MINSIDLPQPVVTGSPPNRSNGTGESGDMDISQFFNTMGVSGRYVITSGALPTGLNLDEGSGRIVGNIDISANPTPAAPAVTFTPVISFVSIKSPISVTFNWDVIRVVRVAYAADTGDDNGSAMYLSTSMERFKPELVVIGGDNNYPYGEANTIDNRISIYQRWFDQELLLPCYGNHDLDNDLQLEDPPRDPHQVQYDKFYYLPGNRRYYSYVHGNIEFFCLNTGKDSNPPDGDHTYEPDGCIIGSAQHTWFVAAAAASTAKFKVAFFHHGFAVASTSETSAMDRDEPRMNWFFETHGIDLILNGHNHASTRMTYTGPGGNSIPIINASSAVRPPLRIDPAGPYVQEGEVVLNWAYNVTGSYGPGNPLEQTRYWLALETRGNDMTAKFVDIHDDTSPDQIVITKP